MEEKPVKRVKTIKIEGWFYHEPSKSSKPKPGEKETKEELTEILNRLWVPEKYFVNSAKEFQVSNLMVLSDCERLVGGWLSFIKVVGVVDTKGSTIPFFIDEKKIKKLKKLIKSASTSTVL